MTRFGAALAGWTIAWSIVAGGASAQQAATVVPSSPVQLKVSFAPIVRKVRPAVVNVYASRTDKVPQSQLLQDPVFRQLFGLDRDGGAESGEPRSRTERSLGSGVIVDGSGLVVTNYHVIAGMTDVKVSLADRREFEADIVLRDQRTDLSVLRLKGGVNFPVLEMGDSDALEVGDFVLALGNPFGVGQTVTQGIVSALARTQIGASDYQFFIQTDAAINPGNSGGALVDTAGRLVGINSSILSRSGGSMGIGFAIPVNMVRSVVTAAKNGSTKVRRPWLGASLQSVSSEIAETMGLDRPAGALVASTVDKSPAARAGLKHGDVVTAVDGQAIDDPDALGFRLATKPLGGLTSLSVMRDGKSLVFPMDLQAAPEVPPRDPVKVATNSPFAGATVINISPAVREDFSLENVRSGVLVAEVEAGSTAAEIGLQKGDIVISVNGANLSTSRDLEKATVSRAGYWEFSIQRGGQVLTTRIRG